MKKYGFLEKVVFVQSFLHGYEEFNLDNAAKKVSIEDKKHFAHCPKTIKETIFLKKRFLSQCFYKHPKCSMGKPIEKSLPKRERILLKLWKSFEIKDTLFSKNSFT